MRLYYMMQDCKTPCNVKLESNSGQERTEETTRIESSLWFVFNRLKGSTEIYLKPPNQDMRVN